MENEFNLIGRTVMNLYGVKIIKGCASCRHKQINQDGIRYCPKRRKEVRQLNWCKEWQMSKLLKHLQLKRQADEAKNE